MCVNALPHISCSSEDTEEGLEGEGNEPAIRTENIKRPGLRNCKLNSKINYSNKMSSVVLRLTRAAKSTSSQC